MFSLLDVFSGYNQVLVAEQDQLKTTFHTKCRTFTYKIMPFDLMNSRATFQRAMDIVFIGLVGHCVVVYLDDVTFFSKKTEDHVFILKQFFYRCRKYGISLNPKKSIFILLEVKILGNIISMNGISIY